MIRKVLRRNKSTVLFDIMSSAITMSCSSSTRLDFALQPITFSFTTRPLENDVYYSTNCTIGKLLE